MSYDELVRLCAGWDIKVVRPGPNEPTQVIVGGRPTKKSEGEPADKPEAGVPRALDS